MTQYQADTAIKVFDMLELVDSKTLVNHEYDGRFVTGTYLKFASLRKYFKMSRDVIDGYKEFFESTILYKKAYYILREDILKHLLLNIKDPDYTVKRNLDNKKKAKYVFFY